MTDTQELWKAGTGTHQWETYRDVCKACGRTALEVVDQQIYQCDHKDEELQHTLSRALKHHGY